MRTLLPLLVTLLLQAFTTSLTALLHLPGLRPEPAIAVIAFAAVRLDPIAGVVTASAIGYATDLMCSAPPGLHMLAFTILYLGTHSVSGMMGIGRVTAAAPLAFAASAATRLVLALTLALFAEGGARVGAWQAQVASVIIDGLMAVPIWIMLEGLYRRLVPEADLSWRRP